jgi:transcriptional regulator with XRE-family HTH domain
VRLEDSSRVKRNVGRRIAELRTAADLSQDDLAEKLDVSVKWLQRVERGVENLGIETLVKIVNGLHARMGDLFRTTKLKAPPLGRPVARPASPAKRRRASPRR